MPVRFRPPAVVVFLAAILAALGSASPAGAVTEPDRTARLAAALKDPATHRSVYFIRGMSCRACTMLIDRALNGEAGIHWARFNYPLRLFTVYHDPVRVKALDLERRISESKELDAVLLKSGTAAGALPGEEGSVATWEGGSLGKAEAEEAFRFFEETIRRQMIEPGTDEWKQVRYEIFGEAARRRILGERARKSGYTASQGQAEIPMVVSKDFYWPVEHLAATAEESAVARFLREKVIHDREDEKGRELFDDWLFALWKEIGFEFRGEVLEFQR